MLQFDASLYRPFFTYSLIFITLAYYFSIYNKDDDELMEDNTNSPLILFYIFAFILLIGWRPISGRYFGDTSNYARQYEMFVNGFRIYDPNSSEWFFSWIMYKCSKVMDVSGFFLLVECCYVLPVLYACRRWAPNNYCLMMVFCMGAFSFFSYGVNGMRNGMACSMIIAAFSLISGSNKEKIVALLLAFLAFNTHRSTALPIICAAAAWYIKDARYVMAFWVLSIFVSLVASGPVEAFFTGLGFDDRMSSYSSANVDAEQFSSTGFRWDFLLYSAMPIWLGYYLIYKREIWDKQFLFLFNTYVLCNSFWVMMIRASYSNRFAYLSWFMYPLVLAYPLMKLRIWDDQGRKAGMIMMAHIGFTWIMSLM